MSIYFCKLCERWLTKALYTYIGVRASLIIHLHAWNALQNHSRKSMLEKKPQYSSGILSDGILVQFYGILWPSIDPWKILCTLQCHQTWQAWLVTAWFGNYEIRFGNCEQRIRQLWCGTYDYDLETQNRTADSETMIQKLRHLIWKLCRKPELETMNGKLLQVIRQLKRATRTFQTRTLHSAMSFQQQRSLQRS